MVLAEENLYNAIFSRRSRRQFAGQPLTDKQVFELNNFAHKLNQSITGVRAKIVTQNPESVFKGAVGGYGKIKFAPAYVAFIGNMQDLNIQEKLGFFGEVFILKATSMGLGTCWVGGFFKPEIVQAQIEINAAEQVLAVSPIGHVDKQYTIEEKIMSGFAKEHKRKELAKLLKVQPLEPLADWVNIALNAARLAPSAVNRQPWRFSIENGTLKISLDSNKDSFHISKRLDCGIAMAHIEIGAQHAGVTGRWEYLTHPDVAEFVPLGK